MPFLGIRQINAGKESRPSTTTTLEFFTMASSNEDIQKNQQLVGQYEHHGVIQSIRYNFQSMDSRIKIHTHFSVNISMYRHNIQTRF